MTPISEIIFSGFVSKVVNDIVDISKDKIIQAVKNKKTEHQTIESQIYNVIVDVLNKITYNQYENNQDKIYDTAEGLLQAFKEYKYNGLDIKFCIRSFGLDINGYECSEFNMSLYEELSREEYSELFRVILLLQLEHKNQYDRLEYEQLNQKLNEVISILNRQKNEKKYNDRQKVKSRTQEYADKWDANMFLNDFDKRDQNAGTNVKLKEVYLEEQLPHYIWYKNDEDEPLTDLKELLSEYINEKRDNQMLFILGQPGIGKSTLITWITNKFLNRINDILVYRFVSDLGNINWYDEKISNRLLEELNINYDNLDGKTLILDGFDEVSIEAGRRRDILDSLYGDLIYNKTIKKFSLIILCRENYVPRFALLKCRYITLQPWNEEQIKNFCMIFQRITKNNISESTIEKLIENKEILGVPLILYMVLALNISIEKEGSIVDVYDKIFSLEGGIYDRCIENKNFAAPHRIGKIKKQIHQISREIAIWIFENNADKAYILQKEYEEICKNIMQGNINQDYLIGNYFKLIKHCEGIGCEEIYFVHRSIYEYFVIEAIYCSIEQTIKEFDNKELIERIAGINGRFLKGNILSPNMLEFLQYKMQNGILNNKFYIVNKAFKLMLEDGMTYYSGECYKNAIKCEMNVFTNMLDFLHLWKNYSIQLDLSILTDYVGQYKNHSLNLSKSSFNGQKLCYINLNYVNLSYATLINTVFFHVDLSYANLYWADLSFAKLTGVNLYRADLREADIQNIEFKDTCLIDAIFDEKQLFYINKCELSNIKVCLDDTKEIVSYKEYKKRGLRKHQNLKL